jgi:pimeloyl-ACP methyl ester carboxylesterase
VKSLIVLAMLAVAAPSRAETPSFGVEIHGHGRPVILIPGLGCPPSVWDATVAHLAEHNEVHVIAIAGFAGRPAISRPLSATVRTDLASYIREKHLDHPVIVGHSLGGFIAFWLAATEPELVGPTIIADAAPNMFADSNPRDVAASAAHWRGLSAAQFPVAVAQYFGGMSSDRKQLDRVIASVARSDQRAFVDALVEMAATDIRGQMKQIAVPVLDIVAEGKSFYDEVNQQLAPIREHAVVMLRNTRHFVFFDDPTGFFREVDRFLAAHPEG